MDSNASDVLPALLEGSHERFSNETPSSVVGTLLALTEGGAIALVRFPGQLSAAAMRARTTVDLLPHHMGLDVLLAFDGNDLRRPIVTGLLRGQRGWPAPDGLAQVGVEADGQRLTITAQDQLVLRCGRSSVTLSANGRLELHADVIVSHARGVNRVRGGSVQLN